MARNGAVTRERLIDAAEKVFAAQGIEQANLRDVNRAAGQSNNSALHYHFGSREALLKEVLKRHRAETDAQRRELVAGLSGTVPSIADLLVVSIWPLAFQLESSSGRSFLRIALHIRHRSEVRTHHIFNPDSSDDLRWAYAQLQSRLRHLPESLRDERLGVWIDMAVAALAGRAECIDHGVELALDNNAFMNNLIDMGVAALTAPSSLVASD
ncbi:TetR/AcrR family transcriptional regulator [Nocardia vermiculata]|uniref:Helix-turn-helix transcriptional regulator n=1 Tax=Nocardia vermiculata TaxID=257274 RepID=A0A846Y616_9NOCA|nr:helix-turn-helix domain-containing protein [Nocardia vermiculata]NKY54287.1 helix-turn-helix transcriptional regulator [Nocardia vermiculata]